MALFTRLDADDFAALAAAFGLGAPLAWEGLEAGTVNSNYFLRCAGGAHFVRVNEGKSVADVEYEAALVNHLAARGVPTPRALLAAGGRPYAERAGRLITIFPRVAGEHRSGAALTPSHLRQLGAGLARLHAAAADFPARRESIYTFERIVERRRGIPDAPALAPALADCDDEIAWLDARLPRSRDGTIHGDLFPDNVLFDEEGSLTALLDFEQASDGRFAYDLAVCLCAWCFGDADFAPPLCAALYAGYRPAIDPAALYLAARQAALRFTITRITDVELNPAAAARRASKSYRRFHARLLRLRALGEGGFRALLGG